MRAAGVTWKPRNSDEPGATKALIELKLSANVWFEDRPGACKLIATAVSRGDQGMAARLAECRKADGTRRPSVRLLRGST